MWNGNHLIAMYESMIVKNKLFKVFYRGVGDSMEVKLGMVSADYRAMLGVD